MGVRGCVCVFMGLTIGQVKAQQLDSARIAAINTGAVQQFLAATGPAEYIFSFSSLPPYRFQSGVYSVSDLAFPLLNSPDSLVQHPIARAHRQRRTARITAIATVVPLTVLAYSATRILFALGSAVTGRRTSLRGLPSGQIIRASGIAAMAGVTLTATFNISSIINLQKGVRRHNRSFGRKLPTLFNPRGL